VVFNLNIIYIVNIVNKEPTAPNSENFDLKIILLFNFKIEMKERKKEKRRRGEMEILLINF
jgi:hypothetical protein